MQSFQTMRPTSGFVAMGASAVHAALEPNQSGSVSKQSFVSGMTNLVARFRSASASGG